MTDSTTPTHQTASTTGLTITINPPLLQITNTGLPNGTVGVVYAGASETASGGVTPYTYSATGLPSGLSINASTGAISGTPLTATNGAVSVTITATDSSSPNKQTASTTGLTITIAPPPLTITNTALPSGTVNTAYSASETASGGTTPYTYSATGLPSGLSINTSTGAISGTPTTVTTNQSVTITVTDSSSPHQTASTSGLTITISSPNLTITNTALPNGQVGTAYSASETASGGTQPYTYTATGLPGGLSINGATGAITGTPTTATGGPVSVTVTATDSSSPQKTASTSGLTITIAPLPLQINDEALVTTTGMVGSAYSASLSATGGTKPYTFSATGLPAGLTINSSSGLVSGIPLTGSQGQYNVSVAVKDSSSPQLTSTASALLTINPAQPTVTISGGTVGQGLLLQLTITLSGTGSPGGSCQIGLTGCVVVTTDNSNVVSLAATPAGVGAGSASVDTAANQTVVTVYAIGSASAGTANITASLSGFVSGTATVTAAPSAFVLAGPNGNGGAFTVGENSTTTLTVSAAQLDSSGNVAQIQGVAHQPGQYLVYNPNTGTYVPSSQGPPVLVTLTAGTGVGTVSPSSVTFTAGASTATTTFTASSTPVTSNITVNSAAACDQVTDNSGNIIGCTPAVFITPGGGANVVPVTVSSLVMTCQAVTVGVNLENITSCQLSGAAPIN